MPFLLSLLLLSLHFTTSISARKTPEKILLSNVKTLTLRKDLQSTHNRVSPIPQLTCHGPACTHHQPSILRCKNQGADYNAEDIQWTCTASLPPEFKLGSTDVICEGFASADDPYVLKGSCGVDYRLLLTEAGEERYGRLGGGGVYGGGDEEGQAPRWVRWGFWVVFLGVLGWIVWAAFWREAFWREGGARGGGGGGGWGGYGGGGGWGGGDDAPPPPPYSRFASQPKMMPAQGQEGWRPGFWSGIAGGAAAGYLAGGRGQGQRDTGWGAAGRNNGGMWAGNDNGEGSSRWGSGGRTRSGGSSGGTSFSSTRHESSGFGSTSRR